MQKSIVKLVRKSKNAQRKHVEGARKILNAMTALNNDSQYILHKDLKHLYWLVLIEGYEI